MTAILPPVCDHCDDHGFTYDTGCLADTCAHAGAWRRRKDKDGKVTPFRRRVMPCPKRPCPCHLGDRLRKRLRNRARAQEAAWRP